ncbi:mucoidy inhibitor MuiA family protein [Thalassobius sp. MITS945101]|uniref:DUF4139 domain-containing protein n=1 Tax=Thalassobius sp. MITS945101 TaxID=3096994 RepID=UPI00399B9E27
MRHFAFLLSTALVALPVMSAAETFQLQSRISEVIVYPQGAKVTRVADYEIPAGSHQLRVLDLPQNIYLERVRAKLTGARLGAVSLRDDFVPPVAQAEDAVRAAAEVRLEAAEEALAQHRDEIRSLQLTREAAETAIGFLRGLGEGEALEGAGAEELRQIARMMGEETLAAREAVLAAEAEIRQLNRELPDLEQAVKAAQQALVDLSPKPAAVTAVDVSAQAEGPQKGQLRVSYFVGNAGWQPVNDAFLDLEAAQLTIKRGALVKQATGENWDQVALVLSTSQPTGKVAPAEVVAERRWLEDPERRLLQGEITFHESARADDTGNFVVLKNEIASPASLRLSYSTAQTEILAGGLIVTYAYPQKLSLATGADAAKLALGSLEFTPNIAAEAVPLYDGSAFLTATFTNDSGEEILPTNNTQLFLDGEFVGSVNQPLLSSGAEARLPFGPIEGLQLTRDVTRNQGDRGILTKSNERVENIRIGVENLTDRAWTVRLVDRVPYGEQEDLQITWNALPEPSEKNVDGKRGVLAWTFELPAGKDKTIKLDQRLSWPEEMVLR